jgi:hypothetical protein
LTPLNPARGEPFRNPVGNLLEIVPAIRDVGPRKEPIRHLLARN